MHFLDMVIVEMCKSDKLAEAIAQRIFQSWNAAGLKPSAKTPKEADRTIVQKKPGLAKAVRGRKAARGGAADAVLAAVRAGASKKAAIMKKAKVSSAGYQYGVKSLKAKGLIKVVGDRAQAQIVAA